MIQNSNVKSIVLQDFFILYSKIPKSNNYNRCNKTPSENKYKSMFIQLIGEKVKVISYKNLIVIVQRKKD